MLNAISSREICQCASRHGVTYVIECSVISHIDQRFVHHIDGVGRDVTRADLPVIRVVLPDDRAQAERIGNCSNAVINVAIRRLRGANALIIGGVW
jgi:hypothetical protein